MYLSISSDAVSAVLIRETAEGQKHVYFTSKALLGPETRYQRIEKVEELRTKTKQSYKRFSASQASRIEELSLWRSMRSSEWKIGGDPYLDT
jgi:hypothetical protein